MSDDDPILLDAMDAADDLLSDHIGEEQMPDEPYRQMLKELAGLLDAREAELCYWWAHERADIRGLFRGIMACRT